MQLNIVGVHMKLSSDDLMITLALSQEGTLEKASRSLGKDESTVFRAIKRIEAKLGRALFTRSHRGFKPVTGIEPLLRSAQLISGELASVNEIWGRVDEICGGLNITTTDLLLNEFIAPRLAEFCKQYPDVELSFNTQNHITHLWERSCDVAIRASNTPPEHMIGSQIMSVWHQVVSRPECLLGGNPRVDSYWLVPGGEIAGHPTYKWLQENFCVVSDQPRMIRYDSMLQIRNAAISGLGIACLPLLPGSSQQLAPVSRFPICCKTDIWALYHPANKHNTKIRAFISFLKKIAETDV